MRQKNDSAAAPWWKRELRAEVSRERRIVLKLVPLSVMCGAHLWLVWLSLGPLRAVVTTVPVAAIAAVSLNQYLGEKFTSAERTVHIGWLLWVGLNVATFVELLVRGFVRVTNDFLP